MYGIYAYLCVSCVQLIAPTCLMLFFIMEMNSQGDLRLGLFTSHLERVASQSVLTPLFIKGIFSFLTWWFTAWWFVVSVAGFVYERARYSVSQ